MTKEKISYLLSHRFRRRSGDTRELAERLAPLEELAAADSKKPVARFDNSQVVAQEEGAIVVGRNKPALPDDVMDRSDRNGIFGLEPVVIVIVGLLLLFIAFVAWQVSQMPAPQVIN